MKMTRILRKANNSYFNEMAMLGTVQGQQNVIQLHDAIQTEKYGYLFLRLAEYDNMKNYIESHGLLREDIAMLMFRQLLEAIQVSSSINVMKTQY